MTTTLIRFALRTVARVVPIPGLILVRIPHLQCHKIDHSHHNRISVTSVIDRNAGKYTTTDRAFKKIVKECLLWCLPPRVGSIGAIARGGSDVIISAVSTTIAAQQGKILDEHRRVIMKPSFLQPDNV